MNRPLAFVLIFALAAVQAAAVYGAGSTNSPPPAAKKEGGVEGDPLGAIRALGGTSQNDFREENNKVEVPKLGGGAGAGQTGGAPVGTTGGR